MSNEVGLVVELGVAVAALEVLFAEVNGADVSLQVPDGWKLFRAHETLFFDL